MKKNNVKEGNQRVSCLSMKKSDFINIGIKIIKQDKRLLEELNKV